MPVSRSHASLSTEVHTANRTLVRIVLAAPLVAWAALIAYRAWNPLYHGCSGQCKDSGGPVCLSMAAVMFAVAVLLATVAAVIASPPARRYGYLVIACLAVIASVLPALFFKWDSRPDSWPWIWIAERRDLGWLRFDQSPRDWFWAELPSAHWVGVTMQLVLALSAAAAVVAHIWYRLPRRAAPLASG